MRIPSVLVAFGLAILPSCSQPAADTKTGSIQALLKIPHVDGNAMNPHIQKLASDEMEGRAPGGKGEELATSYIANFFKSIGLQTQFQAVPMVGITSIVSSLELVTKTGKKVLKYGNDFMGWSRHEEPTIKADAELVFCGYGVVAPEY